GPLAPAFYGELIASIVAICVCFIPRLRTSNLIPWAALLALVGVFCKRFQFLASGFATDGSAYGGMITPASVNTVVVSAASYVPSFLEIGVVLGVVALGVLVFLIGIRKLPLVSNSVSK
ncbi:MAG: polysulfide reductase, partial [Raoultibacter sp.]